MIVSDLNASTGPRLAHTDQVAGLEDIQRGWNGRPEGETIQLHPEASSTYAKDVRKVTQKHDNAKREESLLQLLDW